MMSKFLFVSATAGGSTRQHRTRSRETYNRILRTEVDVDGDAEVKENASAFQSAVKKVGGYSLPEYPKCEGCGGRPHECWWACGATAAGMGTCDKCDSAKGAKGACCRPGNPYATAKETNDCRNAVEYPAVTHAEGEDPYHVCVLIETIGGYSLPEYPKCEGCGGKPHECWWTCGGTQDGMGTCDKCDSAEGSKGACCRDGWNPHATAKETNDCQNAVEYPALTRTGYPYHVCVLTETTSTSTTTIGAYLLPEVPKCEGCGSGGTKPHSCFWTCSGPPDYEMGTCDKCDSAEGSKGACCRLAWAHPDPNEAEECAKAVEYPAVTHAEYPYHVCVLTETTSTSTTTVGAYLLPEVPKCEGCGSGGKPYYCFFTCREDGQSGGTCHKCDSAEGSKGACCQLGWAGYADTNEGEECANAVEYPAVTDAAYPYHVCVLTETTSTSTTTTTTELLPTTTAASVGARQNAGSSTSSTTAAPAEAGFLTGLIVGGVVVLLLLAAAAAAFATTSGGSGDGGGAEGAVEEGEAKEKGEEDEDEESD